MGRRISAVVVVLGTNISGKAETYTDVYSDILMWLFGGSPGGEKEKMWQQIVKINIQKQKNTALPSLSDCLMWAWAAALEGPTSLLLL